MAAKVKYPVKAALARFAPIRNHLANLESYLIQADLYGESWRHFLMRVRLGLTVLENDIKPFREK